VIVVRFTEDLAIFEDWLRELIQMHFSPSWEHYPLNISTHVQTPYGRECDLIISNKKGTSVLCELKDWTVKDTLQQVIVRRPCFDFAYAVINQPTYQILNMLRKMGKERLERILSLGIGIISSRDNVILVRSYRIKKHAKELIPIIDEILKSETESAS